MTTRTLSPTTLRKDSPDDIASTKTIAPLFIRLAGTAVLLTMLCGAMRADLGLMLDESLKVGGSKWTGAGHSAVYLSGVCMASPLELRMCGTGENGVVLTHTRSNSEGVMKGVWK